MPNLEPDQIEVARNWLDVIAKEVRDLEERGKPSGGARTVITLKEDKTIGWAEDGRWDEIMKFRIVVPGEE